MRNLKKNISKEKVIEKNTIKMVDYEFIKAAISNDETNELFKVIVNLNKQLSRIWKNMFVFTKGIEELRNNFYTTHIFHFNDRQLEIINGNDLHFNETTIKELEYLINRTNDFISQILSEKLVDNESITDKKLDAIFNHIREYIQRKIIVINDTFKYANNVCVDYWY